MLRILRPTIVSFREIAWIQKGSSCPGNADVATPQGGRTVVVAGRDEDATVVELNPRGIALVGSRYGRRNLDHMVQLVLIRKFAAVGRPGTGISTGQRIVHRHRKTPPDTVAGHFR